MKNKISISIKISVLVMFISLLGIAILSYISYSQTKDIFTSHTEFLLKTSLKEYEKFIKNSMGDLKDDVTFLSYNPTIKGFIRAYKNKYKYDEVENKTFSQYKKDLDTILSVMIKQNLSYFQIRIIDSNNGKELIKLVRNKAGKVVSLPTGRLQNKWTTKYVQDTLKLKDKIYFSKIDLNKEYHTIEFPVKPTIRAAKLIMVNHKIQAIAVINANIKKLFNFGKLRQSQNTKTYIGNMNGDYIFDYDNPEKEFGWEFGHTFKITSDFPVLNKIYKNGADTISIIDKKNNLILEAKKVYIAPKRYIVILKTTSALVFAKKSHKYIQNLIISIVIITLFIALLTSLFVYKITKPIKDLTNIANTIAKTKGEKELNIKIESNDEIGELAKAFNEMLKSLVESKKEIEQFATKLEKEVDIKTKELQNVNKNLQKIVEEKVQEIRKKDQALGQQSKLAAMGEMIGSIAHQWRQPLNALAINIQMLEDLYEDGGLDKETLEEFIEKNMQIIQFMSNTIDDFRNFFRKDKEKSEFDIKEVIEKTLNLQKAQLSHHKIKVETDLESVKIKGYKNEFMQAILNIISNAKDAIEEKRKKGDFEGVIKIKAYKKGEEVVIEIEDNGGGVPEEIRERLFEPYFTTKEEGKGTGMGLYMVKEIIERMNGEIKEENTENGAKFIITLKEENEN